MRAIAAEFLGTFALVFFGCGAIANGLSPTSVALAFGLVIAVMVYALGHISGAHFNPAVSIAFAAAGRHAWSRTAAFVVAQILGATVGALALSATLGAGANLGLTQPSGSAVQAFAWEVVLTFFLMLVITSVATDERAVGEAAAIAIGGTVALGSLVGGSIEWRFDESSSIDRTGRRVRRLPGPVDLPHGPRGRKRPSRPRLSRSARAVGGT